MQLAELRDGLKGWWIWVRASWKGHPDFGVKLHRYQPADVTDNARMIFGAQQSAIKQWQDQNARKVKR